LLNGSFNKLVIPLLNFLLSEPLDALNVLHDLNQARN